MAYKPISGAPLPAAPSSTYKPVSTSGVIPQGAPDESGSPSLFGFLGNIGQEIKDMAQGVTSLAGAAVGDVGNLALEAVTLGNAETDYKLDDIAMALPKALAQDYNSRYGLSKFAEGDIWGGLKAVLTGLYEHPLSAVGDALMVGSAVKWTAKAGLLGDAGKAAVLGPGATEAASLTGSAGGIPQVLSENPVARLAQRKLYEVMSYGGTGDRLAAKLGFGGPQDYIVGRTAAGATDEAIRATENLAKAAGAPGDIPMRVLRPTASKFLEKRGVSTILSHMGMGIGDRATKASAATRAVLEPLDDITRDEVTSIAMGTRGVLPDVMPSDATSVHWKPLTEPADLPDALGMVDQEGRPLAATPGTSPRLLDAAQTFGEDFTRIDPRNAREIVSPHDMTAGEKNAVMLQTDDMDAAYDVAKKYADTVQGQIIARRNYTADVNSSYDGIHYFVQDPDGVVHDVSVASKPLQEAQEAWSHMALQQNAKLSELDDLQAQLDELGRAAAEGGGNPRAEMAISEQMARIEDEVQNIEVWNGHTFDFTRRMENAKHVGGDYDPALAAADRIRNITYNHATRIEVKNGLTYRKMIDRAFGPLRAEKWSRMMKIIEEHVSTRLERAMAAGVPKDQWDDIVLGVTDQVLGEFNPWAESMFRTKIKENIPFTTEDVMPVGIGGRPGNLGGKLATGERTIDPRPYAARGYYGAEDAFKDAIESGADEATAIAAYDEVFYAGASEEIAHRLTQRLREATHKSMVENGEMPGLQWTDLAREQETGGLPFPQYFPHVKVSKVTGDVAILNQNRSQMKTVLESPDARMKKWGGWLYEKGTFERDPIKAYEAMFRQVQRHQEFRDAMQTLIDKYGRQVSPDELANWDLDVRGEVLVSRTGLDDMVDARSKLITLTHEGVMDGRTLEDATVQALDAVLENAMANGAAGVALDDIWALPKYVAQQMKTAAKLQLPGTFNFYYDSAMGAWKSAALSLSPRWVINNTLGNSIYMGMSRPGAIRHFVAQLMPGARARFKAAMGEDMLNAIERDFMHGEDLLTSTQRLARRAERGEVGWGARVAESPLQQNAVVGGVRSFSHNMRQLNKYIEGAARRGVAIDDIRRANMTRFGERFLGSKQILTDASARGISDMAEYDRIIKSVNGVLGDYLTMSPVESQIIRRFVMPFYAFYRHTAKFLARMPFEHPLKVSVLQQIAEVDAQLNPYMPDYMLGTANIGGLNFQFGGANPLEAVTQTYAPQVTNPVLGLAVQRMTGTNPFGREWTNEPPGGSVTLFGGERYVIHRNAAGQVTGVQPAGDWAPPLYESILGIVPQAAMIFDPFDRSVAKRIAGPLTGLSFPNYDPATAQYYAVKDQLAALKAAVRTPPPA